MLNISHKSTVPILLRITRTFTSKLKVVMDPREGKTYEDAIAALNGLQSNADYIRNARKNRGNQNGIVLSEKCLERSGLSFDDLDKLSVIHVTGTKGKGTTCALCESILRHHGYKTGFYSSPHLLEVRERIRINGIPLQKDLFAMHFWDVYEKLDRHKEHPNGMPQYFRFLTILAFNVFCKEKVDVAIVEVGIGGELDCTNIVRNTQVVGITSLGIDHTVLLGNTIQEIAWHKAGIMKKGCKAFTAPQTKEAFKVLQERSLEKNCTLEVIEPLRRVPKIRNVHMPAQIFKINAGLAIALANAWISVNGFEPLESALIKQAIENTSWPGRFQIIKEKNIRFYLDGAHTLESVEICMNWYLQKISRSSGIKVLIFNVIGDRDSEQFLKMLQKCNFSQVYFVPNRAFPVIKSDQINHNITENEQILRSQNHQNIWLSLEKDSKFKADRVLVSSSVNDALQQMMNNEAQKCNVLVTGSIHLVGATLAVINSLRENSS